MKRGKTGIPTYSKNSPALREYKELVNKIKEDPSTDTESYKIKHLKEMMKV
jgi:predicted nucleic acid-binding Zn ribbon protein